MFFHLIEVAKDNIKAIFNVELYFRDGVIFVMTRKEHIVMDPSIVAQKENICFTDEYKIDLTDECLC